jgi:inosose dehydratase
MDGAVSAVRLAGGPVSWGVDFASAPANPPWSLVLDGIRDAGYDGLELGPVGYLPEDPARLREEIGRRGLELVAGFVFEPLHDATQRERIVGVAGRVAALVAAAGGRHLVVIDLVVPERAAAAGRSERAPRLDREGRRALTGVLLSIRRIAEAAGLVAVVHPHAGSYVEFADEIAAIAELAPLCIDTGHAAYARLDPARLLREHGERVALLHLKDTDPAVLERGLGYWDAIAAGVFCPAGRGVVDFAAVAAALRETGYSGWATVEQDRAPGSGDPVADLVAGRMALQRLGLGA